jgi:hypothetical protein
MYHHRPGPGPVGLGFGVDLVDEPSDHETPLYDDIRELLRYLFETATASRTGALIITRQLFSTGTSCD